MTSKSPRGIQFSDKDIVEIGNAIWKGDYNPHNVRPWLLHDHGFVICVVFADCLQDALDEAVDNNKLDHLQIDDKEVNDQNCEQYTCLGNASEWFDIESLGVEELPNPPMSFVALFNAAHPPKET